MVAAGRSAPISVLSEMVDLEKLTGAPGPEWARISCASKRAYGCGECGQAVAEGLSLYLRLAVDDADLTSYLAIRISDEALQRVRAELLTRHNNRFIHKCRNNEVTAHAAIRVADRSLVVLTIVFHHDYCLDITYYLVYDSIDASLAVIKFLPDDHSPEVEARTPVPGRAVDGGCYELLVMARNLTPHMDQQQEVLCVCTPAARAANPASDDSTGPWEIKARRFNGPEMICLRFSAEVVFSFEGKAFWADLSEGIMCCDMLSNPTTGATVDIDFISLPPGCEIDDTMDKADSMKFCRNISCVGDSIWFVCIDYSRAQADDFVKTWTLDLATGQWRAKFTISAKMIWGLDGFKEAGLPEELPQFPVLTADGALCVLLPDRFHRNEDKHLYDYICSFDLACGRLLWHGRVTDYYISLPFFVPSNLFQIQHVPCKRKLAEHLPEKTAAGSNSEID
ncbi:hypothetical protein ACP4OV_008585 [Aristida adscensionis]